MPDGLHRAYLVLRVQQQSLALGLPDVTRKEGLGAGEEHALDISQTPFISHGPQQLHHAQDCVQVPDSLQNTYADEVVGWICLVQGSTPETPHPYLASFFDHLNGYIFLILTTAPLTWLFPNHFCLLLEPCIGVYLIYPLS